MNVGGLFRGLSGSSSSIRRRSSGSESQRRWKTPIRLTESIGVRRALDAANEAGEHRPLSRN
jgi:hypothetical protein